MPSNMRRTIAPLVFALFAASGCGSSQGDRAESAGDGVGSISVGGSDTDPGSGSGAGESAGADDTAGSGGSAGEAEFVEVRIEPADAMVEVIDGVAPAATQFTAIGVRADGTEQEVGGVWSIDDLDVGNLDASNGSFLASGIAGGVATVSVAGAEGMATTTLTVKLHYIDDDVPVDPVAQGAFDAAVSPDPVLDVVYPYDQTLFPHGLTAPVVQWNGGGATDVYYLHIDAPTFEYETWAPMAPPARWVLPTMPVDIWAKLTASVTGDVSVSVQRYDGVTAYLPVTKTWSIVDADLVGTIYYWEVNNGNVVRLKVGDPAPQTFIQKPPGVTCVACHSVSANGEHLVAAFHGGYSPWGTFTTADGASQFASDSASGFQAISPDGGHVVWGQSNPFDDAGGASYMALSTFDSINPLATLTTGTGAPVFPSWSPDGKKLAFGVRTDGNWLDFTQSTLWVSDIDLVTPGFPNAAMIVANDGTRPAVVYPTWSPDSSWLAFGRATQARTRGAQGELWLTDVTGAKQTQLAQACGVGVLPGDQGSACYEPTFMPEERGGYFWLVFVSERVYGNTLTDTDVASRRKQLWVTAIDATPDDGVDPSRPAFWLPGQELNNHNMRGAWSLDPPDVAG